MFEFYTNLIKYGKLINRLILSGILTLLPSVTFAEWTFATPTKGDFDLYIDVDSIVYDGQYRKVLTLSNSLNNKEKWSSAIIYFKFDCKTLSYMYLSDKYYEGRMGKGKLLAESNNPSEWATAEPSSGRGIQIEKTCKY